MLTENVISEIEDQIEREFRTIRTSFRDSEKDAAMERIAKLTAMLNPPSVTIVTAEEIAQDNDHPLADLLYDFARTLRNR